MKLGVSFAITTPLPSRWSANVDIASTTPGSVAGVGMISSSRRYRGGLKKWVPSACARKPSERPSTTAAMGMPEVLELTIACGARIASTRANSDCLTSRRSTMASTIQSHSATASRSVSKPPVRTSAAPSGRKKGAGESARARARPSRAASAVTSSSSTGRPAFATCAAICAPIVPAPSTATERIGALTNALSVPARRRRNRRWRRPGRRASSGDG